MLNTMKNKLKSNIAIIWNKFNYNKEITEEEADKLIKYSELLDKWSKKLNLISLTNPEEIQLQITDSLALLPFFSPKSDIDIGSGNGFPAIPLSIFNKETTFYLIEPRKKRVSFLSYVKSSLDLRNINIFPERIEEFSKKNIYAESISSKAFAAPAKIQEISFKLLEKNGKINMLLNENQKIDLMEDKYNITVIKEYKIFNKKRKLVILNRN